MSTFGCPNFFINKKGAFITPHFLRKIARFAILGFVLGIQS